MKALSEIVNLTAYPLADRDFRLHCKTQLDAEGALVLANFLTPQAIAEVKAEGEEKQHLAWFCQQKHNVFLTPPASDFALDHPRNREVVSSKGCITDDQISAESALRTLYDAQMFREFLCFVLGEQALYAYADPLSSINLHFAAAGQELGWHFDNSSFAITLMIQKPQGGGCFEYVKDVRRAEEGEMNFPAVQQILDGQSDPLSLKMDEGTLVLFRGRNSIHRVTPTAGDITRMLVVLAYNGQPNVSLSESARMTFYGRLT
ncbi:MAG: HalD/BesD family halogenase [Thiolinea sp.]